MVVFGGWVEGSGVGGVAAAAKHIILGWRCVVLVMETMVMASSVGYDRGGDVGGENGVACVEDDDVSVEFKVFSETMIKSTDKSSCCMVKGQKEIAVLMLMTMEPDLQRNLENLGAYDMLKELKTLFSQQVEQELLQTVREFHACKQEEGQSEYDSFVQNYNMHGMGKTVNELHAMLKLHEQTLAKRDTPALYAIREGKVQKKNKNKKPQLAAKVNNKGKGKSKLDYAPKPKIPPPPKKEDPAKDSVCYHCGDTDHWKRNCPLYLSELLKNKKLPQGASTSGIFTI
ncbi:zinc finger, CCHC-type containing protein [Tanacetum coccineum]